MATTTPTRDPHGKTSGRKSGKGPEKGSKKKPGKTPGPNQETLTRRRIEEEIADRIIALLDDGQLPPWEKGWSNSPNGIPLNAISMKPYRGINRWLTTLTQMTQGYQDPRWLTLHQANTLGGGIRTGEKSTRIVLWKRVTRRRTQDDQEPLDQGNTRDSQERQRTYTLLRTYSVFNAEQTREGTLPPLPEPEETHQHQPLDAADLIIASMPSPPGIQHYRNANHPPHYQPTNDIVRVPDQDRYQRVEDYYNTVFHELTHATGHPQRLHRFELDANAGDLHAYGQEELVAGMGSAMLAQRAGIGPQLIERDAAYIRHWRDAIHGDKPMVLRAATMAQKAVDHILDEAPADYATDQHATGEQDNPDPGPETTPALAVVP